MRAFRVGLPLILLLVLASFVAYHSPRSIRGQASSATQSSGGTVSTHTLFSGLWRVDGGFVSTIRMKNSLVVGPIDVTPVLYMADGTAYELPPVDFAKTAVATVNVNQALANAPAELAAHLSQFGSAALRYQYKTPGHVLGSMEILNIPQSLVFTYPFDGVEPDTSGVQTLEGLWWRHDPDVGGFVALTNVTDGSIQVSLHLTGSRGTALAAETVRVPTHSTQMLDLDSLASGLSGVENQAGGLRLEYNGAMGAIIASGGLVNEREGYSVNMPFWFHDPGSSAPIAINYASVGLMLGRPDPMMAFPRSTRFTPYTTLRNTTANPLAVTPTINYMSGYAPVSLPLPRQLLNPFETRHLNFQSILGTLGLEDLSGSINLSFSLKGHAGDLLLAAGSVDQTGNYVFAVEPQGVGRSFSKTAGYWSVANGFDTMFTLWNPLESAQDFVVTFFYGDGVGEYQLPVHLDSQASTMIDMAVLIEMKEPDAVGNVIPASVQQGSAVFASAKGKAEWMTLVVSGGVFNARAATCGLPTCITCNGFSDFAIDDLSSSAQLTAQCTYSDGTVFNETASCNWSSDNTSAATVGNGSSAGLVSAVSYTAGTANITATFPSMVVFTGQICSATGYPSCPQAQPTPSVSILTSIWTGKLDASTSLSCYYKEACPNGTSASCPPSQIPFILPVPAPLPCPQYVEVDDFYVVVKGVKKCLFIAFAFNPASPRNCQ